MLRAPRATLTVGLVVAVISASCGAPAESIAPSPAATAVRGPTPVVSPLAPPTTGASPGAPAATPSTPTEPNPAGSPPSRTNPPRSLPPLPASADLPLLPAPAPLPEAPGPLQAAEALLAALSEAKTAEERLPFVMTVMLAAGIPILDENGEPVPFDPAPSGPAMEAWEVHALAAHDPTRHTRINAGDVAELLAVEGAPIDRQAFFDAFNLDLRTAAFGGDPDAQRWGWLVAARDPVGAVQALAITDPDEMFLDGLQLQLVLRRLAVDYWQESVDDPSAGAGAVAARARPGQSTPGGIFGAPAPCAYTPTEDTIVFIAEEAGQRAMGKVIELIANHMPRLKPLTKAGIVADLAKFILPYLLLRIDFELSDPPLVRTKSTSAPGEQSQLAATLHFDTGNAQLINCFRLVFASLGFTFSLPQDGPLANGSVSWEPNRGFERVQFVGNPVHTSSDDQGIAIIGIEGREQKNTVPPIAGRVNTEAAIFLTYRVKELSLGGDLFDALSILEPLNPFQEDGSSTGLGILKLALEGLQRAKWSSASFTFPVVDWGERWQAEIVIDERTAESSMYVSWTGVLGVDSDGIVVGNGAGTLSLITTLCVDVGPDRETVPIDWRVDADFTFRFDGYKENDVLHMLLPTDDANFRQTGDPGPCGIAAAFHRAQMETLLAQMKDFPIQLAAQAGTKSIPVNEGVTMTIRLEPVSD